MNDVAGDHVRRRRDEEADDDLHRGEQHQQERRRRQRIERGKPSDQRLQRRRARGERGRVGGGDLGGQDRRSDKQRAGRQPRDQPHLLEREAIAHAGGRRQQPRRRTKNDADQRSARRDDGERREDSAGRDILADARGKLQDAGDLIGERAFERGGSDGEYGQMIERADHEQRREQQEGQHQERLRGDPEHDSAPAAERRDEKHGDRQSENGLPAPDHAAGRCGDEIARESQRMGREGQRKDQRHRNQRDAQRDAAIVGADDFDRRELPHRPGRDPEPLVGHRRAERGEREAERDVARLQSIHRRQQQVVLQPEPADEHASAREHQRPGRQLAAAIEKLARSSQTPAADHGEIDRDREQKAERRKHERRHAPVSLRGARPARNERITSKDSKAERAPDFVTR